MERAWYLSRIEEEFRVSKVVVSPTFLATNEADSHRWLGNYLRTFLERDIPALGL